MKFVLATVMFALLVGCATIENRGNTDVVKITADGNALLNGKQVPIPTLSESFKMSALIVEAHPSAAHTAVVAVLEEAAEAGIKNVSLMTHDKQK